ncbi:hypothetical protein CWC28_20650 [Pseudoalteromonas sp. S4492]|nr:hypothetical protein CWC28_20650 [Pseudoalteromonas sp. S4492]
MRNHFEGANLSLPALKISHLEQLNNEIFALLSTRFSCLKKPTLLSKLVLSKFTFKNFLLIKVTIY